MHNVAPPPLLISLPVTARYHRMCVCAGERDREELGRGPGGPQGVVVGGIHRSLSSLWVIIPLLFRPGVGWAAAGWWWSTVAFRNSFPPQHSSHSHSRPGSAKTPVLGSRAGTESLPSRDVPHSENLRTHIQQLHCEKKRAPSKHHRASPLLFLLLPQVERDRRVAGWWSRSDGDERERYLRRRLSIHSVGASVSRSNADKSLTAFPA